GSGRRHRSNVAFVAAAIVREGLFVDGDADVAGIATVCGVRAGAPRSGEPREDGRSDAEARPCRSSLLLAFSHGADPFRSKQRAFSDLVEELDVVDPGLKCASRCVEVKVHGVKTRAVELGRSGIVRRDGIEPELKFLPFCSEGPSIITVDAVRHARTGEG